jgi:hypothetical protein
MIDNRIVNGGFEDGTTISPFSGSNVTIINTNSHSGSRSARFAGGTGNASLSQTVPVSPGENFEFLVSLAKLGTSTSPPINIVISYRDSSNNVIPTAQTTISIPSGRLPNNNEDDWMEIYRTTTIAPATATQARVEINKSGLSSSAPVVVDDVALLAITSSGPAGPQGPTGPQGLQGPTGPPGPAGSGTNGDLSVSGNGTIQGNLTVNGNTQLGNESFTDRVRVVGNLEALSNTFFFGTVNVFSRSIFCDENLVVGGSDIIGSGNIQSRTLDLFGSELSTEALRVHAGNIEILGEGFGLILRAPNNTRWLLKVDNNGNLITTPFM